MLALITVTQANSMVHSFDWKTPSWDLFVFLFWAIASAFYAFSAGRGRIISLLMSLYITKLFVLQAPWLSNAINQKLPGSLSGIQQLVSFLIIFILIFILLSRYAFRTSADKGHLASIPFALIFSVLQVGLLINTILGYLAVSGRTFSPLVTTIFLAPPADFIWLTLPLLFLILLGRVISSPEEN
jgi:hypothetical protein